VTIEQEAERAKMYAGPGSEREGRAGSIGLGFRVPLLVASPWSRGGAVCSQVFDHTSILQFLEKFVSHKAGKEIKEENISQWRRTVCGDLTSVFAPYYGEPVRSPDPVKKNDHIELITNAKFKDIPSAFRPLSTEDIKQINDNPLASPIMPKQEKGVRPSRALPYQLYADGNLDDDKKKVTISFAAGNEVFGANTAGSPFLVYAKGTWRDMPGLTPVVRDMRTWNYAVAAGDRITDSWSLSDFDDGNYTLQVYGPNGFYRVLSGNADDPALEIFCEYQRKRMSKQLTGNIQLVIQHADAGKRVELVISDNAYGSGVRKKILGQQKKEEMVIDLSKSSGWYDFTVRVTGNDKWERRYAGHVETGKESISDPLMGQVDT
jgi:phospholipase C